MASSITWYEVLGVLPSARPSEVRRGYDAKAMLLSPEKLTGAPSTVLKAASRAQEIIDAAWFVLGDAARRTEYDEAIGIRRPGEGLDRRVSLPSGQGWNQEDFYFGSSRGAAMLAALVALAEMMGPSHHEPRRITVPDLRGLFYSECMQILGRLGLRVTAVRLTARPMAVDGLVVDQSPAPLAKARPRSTLTVQVWHPPQKTRP